MTIEKLADSKNFLHTKKAFCVESGLLVSPEEAWNLSKGNKYPTFLCADRRCGIPLVITNNGSGEALFIADHKKSHIALCEIANKKSFDIKINSKKVIKKILLDYLMFEYNKYKFSPSIIIQKLDEIDYYIDQCKN